MKKSKIFLGIGSFMLLVAGAWATKSNSKKFATIQTMYYNSAGTWTLAMKFAAGSDNKLVTTTSGTIAKLKTSAGAIVTLGYKTSVNFTPENAFYASPF